MTRIGSGTEALKRRCSAGVASRKRKPAYARANQVPRLDVGRTAVDERLPFLGRDVPRDERNDALFFVVEVFVDTESTKATLVGGAAAVALAGAVV